MQYIAHRINTIKELETIPCEYGVEIDLRDYNGELILQHDPFKSGDLFEDYLKHYNHGTLILNIKSERIEYQVLELLRLHQITDYFFLDSSFPMINLLASQGENKIALRFSEFEGLDTLINMAGRVKWVWVDCFNLLPITYDNYIKLKNLGYNLCLVSPELQSQPEKVELYKHILKEANICFDAICTKINNVIQWL